MCNPENRSLEYRKSGTITAFSVSRTSTYIWLAKFMSIENAKVTIFLLWKSGKVLRFNDSLENRL